MRKILILCLVLLGPLGLGACTLSGTTLPVDPVHPTEEERQAYGKMGLVVIGFPVLYPKDLVTGYKGKENDSGSGGILSHFYSKDRFRGEWEWDYSSDDKDFELFQKMVGQSHSRFPHQLEELFLKWVDHERGISLVLFRSGPDYSLLPKNPGSDIREIETIVELDIGPFSVKTVSAGRYSGLPYLMLKCRIRLIKKGAAQEFYSHDLTYRSRPLSLEKWVENKGRKIEEEYKNIVFWVSETAMDEIFFLWRL